MLNVTGKCASTTETIAFLEELLDVLPESGKNSEFKEKYNSVLNRVRYEITKNMGIKPRALKAKYSYLGTFYNCGNCGSALSITHNYCNKCGRPVLWDSPRCLTK